MERKDQLEGRTRELASLQVGLLGTVLQTLSLRDKMTARHSAAVARYAREIGGELGLSDREQDILHTAALLHDIGKFIFPDSILFASTRLSARGPRDRPPPPRAGRAARRPHGRVRPGGRDRPGAPRADRRQRLPERPLGRADPARRPDHRRGRHLRRHDGARLLPPARLVARGDRGAAARLRRAARRAGSSRRSSACSRSAPSPSATRTTPTSSASSTWTAGSATTRSRGSRPRRHLSDSAAGRRSR